MAKATLADFTQQLTGVNKQQGQFSADLQQLAAMGYGDLAMALAAQGDATAMQLARGAVTGGARERDAANKAVQNNRATLTGEDLAASLVLLSTLRGGPGRGYAELVAAGLDPGTIRALVPRMLGQIQALPEENKAHFLRQWTQQGGGVAMARGGILTRPTAVLAAEAGDVESWIPVNGSPRSRGCCPPPHSSWATASPRRPATGPPGAAARPASARVTGTTRSPSTAPARPVRSRRATSCATWNCSPERRRCAGCISRGRTWAGCGRTWASSARRGRRERGGLVPAGDAGLGLAGAPRRAAAARGRSRGLAHARLPRRAARHAHRDDRRPGPHGARGRHGPGPGGGRPRRRPPGRARAHPRQAVVRRSGRPVMEYTTDRIATYSLMVTAADPRRYATEEQSDSTPLASSTGGLTLPASPPLTLAATTVSGEVAAYNAGDMATRPVLRIDGPVAAPRIYAQYENAAVRALLYAETLGAGDSLVIDVDAKSVILNGTASRRRFLTAQWPEIPAKQTVRFQFTADVYAPGALLTVTWRSAWM
ncbi:hypothetical protein ACFQ60_22345 [Streptomyces zhihengii]